MTMALHIQLQVAGLCGQHRTPDCRRQAFEEMRAAADRNKRAVREQENRLAGLWGDGPAAPSPGAAQQQQAAPQGPRVRGNPDPGHSPAQRWSDPAPQAAARVSPRGGEAGARTPGEPTAEERWGPRGGPRGGTGLVPTLHPCSHATTLQ